ncbi:MAG TPA: group 1 truncated hemoglobin [Steroidobacteraceae bacterium]|nr:group 1 truncated hemoglobin [Steroidobacteraceae bacterium]
MYPRGRLVRLAAVSALVLMSAGARADKTLYESMGGEPALRTAVEHFADLVQTDDRINFTFAEADMSKFKKLIFEQLCNLSGGPCKYTGRDMRTSHVKLNINNAEFNALAEDLYIALDRAGIPYRLQNKLMALLAPMQHDIVTK